MRPILTKSRRHFRSNKRRASFLIIEVLLAMALALLCAIPLVAPHFRMARSEYQSLIDLELDRHAHHIMAQVKEDLYERKIPWDAINHGDKRPKTHKQELAPLQIKLSKSCTMSYKVEYELSKHDFKKKKSVIYRLLNLEIRFTPINSGELKTFTYRLFTQRRNQQNESPP